MTETETIHEDEITKDAILEKFQMQNGNMLLWTIIFAIIGATLYVGVSLIPMPYTMVSILKFGFLPAIVIIALVGAIRGPIAGFLAGYLGEVLYGLFVYNVIVTMTLPAIAYGILGFVVGLATYDFNNGRSLLKLSILSVVGFVFTVLLGMVIGISIENYSTMAALAFSMLPLLTMGIPTLLFLTPVVARVWYALTAKLATIEPRE
ncbi:MAG: ECF transporter S component [Candidatus Thorarchaeota archaeon]|nr:ECF transporter S component [Candidatus Thorarchaeota archaeon]